MTPDQRALLPPPPRCLKCNALDQAGIPGAMRSTCLLRQPMHEECAWFMERRLTADERRHA